MAASSSSARRAYSCLLLLAACPAETAVKGMFLSRYDARKQHKSVPQSTGMAAEVY